MINEEFSKEASDVGRLKSFMAILMMGTGAKIFPIHGIDKDGYCTCGNRECPSPGKHPIAPGWKDTAFESIEQVEEYFQTYPYCNYAINTEGLVVIDVDEKNGGVESFETHLKNKINFDETFCVKTGSGNGSIHLYFSDPDKEYKNRANVYPGIDIRASGGFVVGPGCIHVSGSQYSAANCPLGEDQKLCLMQMPESLEELLKGSGGGSKESSFGEIQKGNRNNSLYSIARRLIEFGISATQVKIELFKINSNSCSDPLSEREVLKILESAEKNRKYFSEEYEPELLSIKPEEAPSFPFDSLGETLGGAARCIYENVQAPDSVCANSILAGAGLAVQGLADVVIGDRKVPLSLYVFSIADSGERKSAVSKIALDAHLAFEKEQIDRYALEYKVYKEELKKYEASLKKKSKENEDGVVVQQPVEPVPPYLMVEEPTYEAVVKMLNKGRPSIGIFSDEGGRFIGGFGMNKENSLKTITGFSGFWDGSPITRARSSEDGVLKLYGRRVSLHLMVQGAVFHEMLGIKNIEHQGFLARCLMSYPPGKVGNRRYGIKPIKNTPELLKYYSAIRQALGINLPVREGTTNELAPRRLIVSVEGEELLKNFYLGLEKENKKGGKYHSIRSFTSKAEEHVIRVAGVLTLFDEPNAKEVGAEYVRHAIDVVNYYIGEALRLYQFHFVDEKSELAELLLSYMSLENERNGKDYFYSTELQQLGPNPLRKRKILFDTLKFLEERGWVISIPGGLKVDGKLRKNVWRLMKNYKKPE